MQTMQGKVAIVTGAGKAGSLGHAAALAFARAGADVAVTGRGKSRLAQVVREVEALGARGLALPLDAATEQAVADAVGRAQERFGRIDVLVNAQQAAHTGTPLARCTVEDMNLAVHSGAYAAFAFLKACYEGLRATSGAVVGFASIAGVEGAPYQATLSAAAEALRSLHRTAAAEWRQYGIRVNTVCALARTAETAKWQKEFPEAYEELLQEIPGNRFAEPDEAGELCVQLAAGTGTGRTLRIDGAGITVLQDPEWV